MSKMLVADRYALDHEIGRGGSGAVWLGRDEVLGRVVALKRVGIPPGSSTFELARAEREARLAARVNHPNVIAVFDVVHEDDCQWLVTEYVDGRTLTQAITEDGHLSADEAAPLLLQAAEALAEAHRTGIIHRDVKPSNILLARDGTVKLSDFGIARAESDASLTQTGLVTGSPAYLAPEVATGASATSASDVWSFGATTYHVLSGRPPYEVTSTEGSAVLATLYKIAHEEPPRLRDAGWLAPLLEVMMDRDPARRPTMDDVVAYLRARHPSPVVVSSAAAPRPTDPTATAVGPPAPQPRRSRDVRTALVAVSAVLALGLVGLVLLVGNDDEDPVVEDAAQRSSSAPSAPSSANSDATTSGPSAADLESFATSYVETAASDPDAGFALLTTDYQARSPDYTDFWGTMSNPRILDVSADPADLTVTYTYQYDWPSAGNRTETVTLRLVREGEQLLIDDAVSSG